MNPAPPVTRILIIFRKIDEVYEFGKVSNSSYFRCVMGSGKFERSEERHAAFVLLHAPELRLKCARNGT